MVPCPRVRRRLHEHDPPTYGAVPSPAVVRVIVTLGLVITGDFLTKTFATAAITGYKRELEPLLSEGETSVTGISMGSQWYMRRADGSQFGPYNHAEMMQFVAEGRILPTDLVWNESMPNWQPASVHFTFSGAKNFPPPPDFAKRLDSQSTQIAAGVLGILLGCLGIHKFILGYTGAGIVMLLLSVLSCGIFAPVIGIIGLIEGIIYLTQSEEEFYRRYIAGRRAWF